MAAPNDSLHSLTSAWEVLSLFLIPIGGGIPAGVLVGKSRGIGWPVTALLYFVSDVILACVFEPLMLGLIAFGRRSQRLSRAGEAFRAYMAKTTSRYGTHLGPLAIILVSFGVDPMTGRTAAHAAGHGFVAGWALVILGDMLYFALLMISTLWLNSVLGDGTLTTVIILVAMMAGPAIIRRLRDRWRKPGHPQTS